jgi:hypothetical protein
MNAITHRPSRFQLPAVCGTIERRMLINFRCEPKVLARMLPSPFRPKVIHGCGLAGICLIRLGGMHPPGLPKLNILTSENAAHRIAVEWDENGHAREGVFVPRRDTNAWLNRLAGGKLFPGRQFAAQFEVVENNSQFRLKMQSRDGAAAVEVVAQATDDLPADSIFTSLAEASEFFRGGAVGWSLRAAIGEFDGMELVCHEWRMEPLAVEHVVSSFFSNTKLFPTGSVKFDSAFLMRNIPHEWQARGQLVVAEDPVR